MQLSGVVLAVTKKEKEKKEQQGALWEDVFQLGLRPRVQSVFLPVLPCFAFQ